MNLQIGNIVRARKKVLSSSVSEQQDLDYFLKDGYEIWKVDKGANKARVLLKIDVDESENYIVCGYTFKATGIFQIDIDGGKYIVTLVDQTYHKVWVLQRVTKNNRFSKSILVDEEDIILGEN